VQWSTFQGLWQSPKCALWPVGFCANSAIMLSDPMVIDPAFSSRLTTVAV
jgi:hypothetical protein